MIIKRITMNARVEKKTEVLQTLASMIEPTSKGCISYRVYKDIENENVFNLITEWKHHEDLDRHMRSDRFAVLLGAKSLLCEPLKIWVYTVSNLEEIETANKV